MIARSLLILLLAVALTSCGTDSGDEGIERATPEVVKDSLSTITGEFIYLSDAAVLKGKNFIYGVELDSVALDLAKKVEPLRSDEFELVPVKVRAKIIQNPGRDGWNELVQIREVLEIAGEGPKKIEIEQP